MISTASRFHRHFSEEYRESNFLLGGFTQTFLQEALCRLATVPAHLANSPTVRGSIVDVVHDHPVTLADALLDGATFPLLTHILTSLLFLRIRFQVVIQEFVNRVLDSLPSRLFKPFNPYIGNPAALPRRTARERGHIGTSAFER